MAERVNLVTGACGFTGSHLVKTLLDEGQKVVASDVPKALAHPKNKLIFERLGLDFNHPNCTVVAADLTDRRSVELLFAQPVSHVFHTASLYDYAAPIELLRRVNIDGTNNLLACTLAQDKLERFIHWSTCGVFGKPYSARDGKKCNIPFSETSPSPKNSPFELDEPPGTHLVNDYSITKWKQEQYVWKAQREQGLPLTIIRPAPIYGPGSDYGHGGIVLAINQGLVPCIPADAKNYITVSVHIDDLVRFTRHCAYEDWSLGQDYNVVDDSIISYHEFMHYLALLVGRRMFDLPLVRLTKLRPLMLGVAKLWCILERKFGVPRVRILEPGSATYMSSSYWISNKKVKETDFEFRYPDVREGMRDTVQWFREMGWLDRSYNPSGAWKEYDFAQ